MSVPVSAWIIFLAAIFLLLMLDLWIFRRRDKEPTLKSALLWSGFWILLALLFNAFILFWRDEEAAVAFFTSYLIEKSLSLDNLFVFIVIFEYFSVPPRFHHKILFWGILGALVMRFIFIFAGLGLFQLFHWIIYVFGALLVWSGIKFLLEDSESKVDPEKNVVVRYARRYFTVKTDTESGHFFVKENGKRSATSLFLVLLAIESSDVVFAIDSVPAVLAISQDAFIVYTSNVMAILGLRALYLALAGMMHHLCYLRYGLSAILIFIGIKMAASGFYKVPTKVSLAVIFGVLLLTVICSLIKSKFFRKGDVA